MDNTDFAIAAAADDNMFHLVRDLCVSLRDLKSFLTVIDIGFSDENAKTIADIGVKVVKLPEQPVASVLDKSYLKAMYLRPALPELIAADYIMWIDADCWIQDLSAIRDFKERASKDTKPFAICSMIDVDYTRMISGYIEYMNGVRSLNTKLFGADVAARLYGRAVLSSGVFCAHRDSPVWKAWQSEVERIYNDVRPTGGLAHISEQCALNRILHETNLYEVLTSDYNWHCHVSQLERRDGHVHILPSNRLPKIVHLSDYKNLGNTYTKNGWRFA